MNRHFDAHKTQYCVLTNNVHAPSIIFNYLTYTILQVCFPLKFLTYFWSLGATSTEINFQKQSLQASWPWIVAFILLELGLTYNWVVSLITTKVSFFEHRDSVNFTSNASHNATQENLSLPYSSLWTQIAMSPQLVSSLLATGYLFFSMKQTMVKRLYHRTIKMEGSWSIHSWCDIFVLSLVVMSLFAACLSKQAVWLYSYSRAFTSGHYTFVDMTLYHTADFVVSLACRMWKLGSRLTVLFWFTYCSVIIRRQVDSFARDPVMDDQIQEQLWNESQRPSLQFEGTNMAVCRLNLIRSSANELRRHSWILSAIILLELTSFICLLLQIHNEANTFDNWGLPTRLGIEILTVAFSVIGVTSSVSMLNTTVASLPGQLRQDQHGKVLSYNITRLEKELRDVQLQFHPTGLQLSPGSFSLVVLTVLASLVTLFVYFGL